MSQIKTISHTTIDALTQDHTSVIHLISSADLVSKAVMLILLVFSIWSWAILVDKYFKYKNLDKKNQKFENLFWSGQVIEQLYDKLRAQTDQPLALIFVAAVDEWKKNGDKRIEPRSDSYKAGLKDRVMQAMDLVRNKELEKIEEGLNFLATVSSSAPFIGLFGTVWGIMNSFQSIAASKNTTLAVVAPGIAEALLATAIGLFAAIPAVIFYNYLTARANKIANKLDDFILELHNLISRSIDELAS